MPDYRRFRVPGGTYFFTVNLLDRRLDLLVRRLDLLVRHIDLVREAVRITKRERPFYLCPLGMSMPGCATGPYAFDCRDAGGRATQGAVAERVDFTAGR